MEIFYKNNYTRTTIAKGVFYEKKILIGFLICLFMSCEKDLKMYSDHPDFFYGTWYTSESNNPGIDTILVFKYKDKYLYSTRNIIDSNIIDTTYFEKGSWKVEYLDLNNNNIFELDENSILTLSIEKSSNNNAKAYASRVLFDYHKTPKKEYIDILAEEDKVIFKFNREVTE